jgi:hypothetical protein
MHSPLSARAVLQWNTHQINVCIASQCGGRIVAFNTHYFDHSRHRYSAFELMDGDDRTMADPTTTNLPALPIRDK